MRGARPHLRAIWMTVSGTQSPRKNPDSAPAPRAPVNVFVSYSHKDELLRNELAAHLAFLRKLGVIREWHERRIEGGKAASAWRGTVHERLESAELILLLVSSDFLESDYSNDVEIARAMDRHAAGSAMVIVIIARPALDWQAAPFGSLQALPSNGVPVASWPDREEAWVDVVRGIRAALEGRTSAPLPPPPSRRLRPDPAYPDDATRDRSEKLERAIERRLALHRIGADTRHLDGEIALLKRGLREGGQIRAGDMLGGRYLLLGQVGRGGVASVWRAHDYEEGRAVAVKVLQPTLALDVARRERFVEGARAMAEIKHEAMVRVLEKDGDDDGLLYFVMELLTGGDLRKVALGKRMRSPQVFELVLRIGGALARAHERRLVHRDIKPANILFDASGAPKLTDFGISGGPDATVGTGTGALSTFAYAAPELIRRPKGVTPRADVYSLGMTAVFALSGAELPVDVLRGVPNVIDGISCSEPAKNVLKRAVSWEEERRYEDAAAFCEALRSALELAPDSKPGLTARTLRSIELARAAGRAAASMNGRSRSPDELSGGVRGVDATALFGDVEAIEGGPESQRSGAPTARASVDTIADLRGAPVLNMKDAYLIVAKAPEGSIAGLPRIRLENNPTQIGRHNRNDIRIDDDNVSRHHARVELRGFSLFLIDNGSRNGTLVNGVKAAFPLMLQDGDRIQIGPAIVLEVVLDARVGSADYGAEVQRASVDPRTGIRTRRYLDWTLEREIAGARLFGKDLALLVVQVDWFRALAQPEDADAVLAELSHLAGIYMPHGATLGRFNADELAIILPKATRADAAALGSALAQAAALHDFSARSERVEVTIHTGCAELLPDDGDAADEIRRRAADDLRRSTEDRRESAAGG
jgi:diguanylate cyclase (GGDEF)-like protein